MSGALTHHARTWRALLAVNAPAPPERGLERLILVGRGFVDRFRHAASTYARQAASAVQQRDSVRSLSDSMLRARCDHLRSVWVRGHPDRAARVETLAIVGEQARRTLGLEPFPVQLAGAAALLDRCVIEMATGEGKTLVAAIAAVALGWRGRGCHVITVNDYLVQRDAEWMKPLYEACGVRVGLVTALSSSTERRRAYAADVTYAINKEIAADFLRDRVAIQARGSPYAELFDDLRGVASGEPLLQRGLECAIVDEADSILIDEAVTPLILSRDAPLGEAAEVPRDAAALALMLRNGEHYVVDRGAREVRLLDRAREAVLDRARTLGGLWTGRRRAEELIVQALTAREIYHRDHQYIVRDGRVVIVDEFTGRLMPDRSWRDGMHQAVEVKEGLAPQPMKRTLARISFQRFFRSYRTLSGMTGTAREARGELWMTYRLPVVPIPTNRPCVRSRPPTRIARSAADRWAAVLDEILALHRTGRPVLVGTRTVDASERLSAALTDRSVIHALLNAARHDQEADIIARAGEPGAVTIATNLAGRGTDIRLAPGIAELGGLHVIITEPHESARIDRQFFGRGARQGDPGSAQLFASLEDDLFMRAAPSAARFARAISLPRAVRSILLLAAQRRAEVLARRRRNAVMRSDDWLDKSLGFAGAGRA